MPNETNNQELLKKLVIARLEVLPSTVKLSIGSDGDFSRDELIKHVKNGDRVGEKIISIELEYLQALKEGLLYVNNTSSY